MEKTPEEATGNDDLEGIQEAIRCLDFSHSSNWGYYDALRANYRRMLVNEVAELRTAKDEALQALLLEFKIEVRNVNDIRKYRSDPEWVHIRQIRDRYGRAMEKVDQVAETANADLKIDIKNAIQPCWCLQAKIDARKPRAKKKAGNGN